MEAATGDTVQMRERSRDGEGRSTGSVHYGTVDRQAEKRLRRFMQLYFYNSCKVAWERNCKCFCSFDGICFVLFFWQLIKVAVVAVMVCHFGKDRIVFHSVVSRGDTTLRHLLLRDWDASWETPTYPPSHGQFAAYKTLDLYERINYAVDNYHHVEDFALGYFRRMAGDKMTATLQLFLLNETYTDNSTEFGKVVIKDVPVPIKPEHFDFETIYERYNTSTISRMLSLSLNFSLHSIRAIEKNTSAALCLESSGQIVFKNNEIDGQVVVDMVTVTDQIKCKLMNISVADWDWYQRREEAHWAVPFCLFSLMFSIVMAGSGVILFWMTKRFMQNNFRAYFKSTDETEQDLPWREYLNFVPYWSIMSGVADTLVICGIFWTPGDEKGVTYIEKLDRQAVGLSIGTLLACCSLLQFLSIHHKCALLLKTLNKAFPNVIAFLVCAAVIFFGFLVCGYVVLGPYNVKFALKLTLVELVANSKFGAQINIGTSPFTMEIQLMFVSAFYKFRKINSASETLAAMIQGDEMYTTFNMFDKRRQTSSKHLIYVFTRLYLFSTIAIFTFVVINLMMAIILGAYEAINKHYEDKENLRDRAPLEKALYRVLEENQTSAFRNSIFQLLQNEADVSGDDDLLRQQFLKFCRVTEDGRDIVRIRPRTLKALWRMGRMSVCAIVRHCVSGGGRI